jgi:penicillin-binding protein 2B
MYNAVYDSITDAAFYKAENVTLVGKSGTAQIPNSYGGYLTGNYDYVRSFAGVFPYEEPRYIVYVAVKRYTGSYRNIAKMVTNVVEEISKYKNIVTLTTETDTSKIITMENFISKDLDTSISELSSRYLNVVAISNGKNIVKQFPPKGSTVLSGNKVFLVSDGNEITLPDFTGWSGSEVATYCSLANIKLIKTGYGNAVSQSIPPGTVMSSDMVLEVTLG